MPVEEGATIEGAMANDTFQRYQRKRKVCTEGYVFKGDYQNQDFQEIECADGGGGNMYWRNWDRLNCTREIAVVLHPINTEKNIVQIIVQYKTK